MNSSYTTDYGIHEPWLQHLARHEISLSSVRCVPVTRKSDESEALAHEQAAKALGTMSRTEPDLAELLATHPVETWLDPEVRLELNIIDVQIQHVMPYRLPGGSRAGTEVVGHLLVYRSLAILIVANSGFSAVLDEQKARLNPYTEAVITLLKTVRHSAGVEVALRLRLAADRRRKGRLGLSLRRMDDYRQRLEFELWYGNEQMSRDAWARLLESFSNETNELERTNNVTGLLTGRLRAVKSGNLPSSEANLPPTLRHGTDPHGSSIDPRVRNDAGHLETFHAVEIQPALEEYLKAFARGATDQELAYILRKHRVPTSRQLHKTKKNGPPKSSAQRESTFDQLPVAEAIRRARRWVTYEHKLQPVPPGGDANVELTNMLAVRKLQLIAEGQSTFKWRNPTPTESRYDVGEDVVEVTRATTLDDGHLESDLIVGFPDRHVVKVEQRWVDATGAPVNDPCDTTELTLVDIPVVTDTVVTDAEGQPVEWTGWGVDAAVVWLCAERLWRRQAEGLSETHTNGRTDNDRLLGTPRWWEHDDEGNRIREWQLWRRGSTQTQRQQVFRHRWLIWRRPEQTWTEIRDGLSSKQWADGDCREHHVASFNEGHAVLKLVDAMKGAVRDYLGGDVALQSPATGDRELRIATARAALQSQLDSLDGQISELEEKIEDLEVVAARKEKQGKLEDAENYDTKATAAKAKRDQLHALKATKLEELERAGHDATQDPTEAFGPDAFETVAQLIALIEKAAAGDWPARRGPGELPVPLARRIAGMFTDWSVETPQGSADGTATCAFSCTWVLTLADGTIRTLPLTGTWTNTMNGVSSKHHVDTEIVRRMLVDGASFDDIARDLVADTSRDTLWRNRVRPLLAEWGVPVSLRAPLYDNPSTTTKQIVAVRLGGAPQPQSPRWTRPLADHVASTYDGTLRKRWNESAVPCDTAGMHAVFEMVAQHPANGVTLLELAAVTAGLDRIAKHMVSPPTTKKQTQPQMLEWRDLGVIGLIPCPHDDCPKPGSFADFLLYLPETVPGVNGTVGGVLCRACRRLPRTDTSAAGIPFRDIRFTRDYLDLRHLSGAAYRSKGLSIANGITHQLAALHVSEVSAATHATVARITRELGISRYQTLQLIDGLAAEHSKNTPDGAVLKLYDLHEVFQIFSRASTQLTG